MVGHVVLVFGDEGHPADGIRDHTRMLAKELSDNAVEVDLQVHTAASGGSGIADAKRTWRSLRSCGRGDAVFVQYMPFCFARWGFAPWLPLLLLAVKARRNRPTIALMVHEPYVPMNSFRWVLMGLWQRFQLTVLRIAADIVFTSIEAWATEIEAHAPTRPVHHLPVGSNFPDHRCRRIEERWRMGIDEATLVVAAMGRPHPTWCPDYVVAALNAIAATGKPLVYLGLGAEAPTLVGLDPSITVESPGFLDADELSIKIAASDLFLAPLLDGISTRRGTVMLALQHGLPVVGTSGPLTDSVFRQRPGGGGPG